MANAILKFTLEQKRQIIQEADQHGIMHTSQAQFVLYVFNRWRNSFNQGGVSILEPQDHKVDPEVKASQNENALLKKLMGNQPLELEQNSPSKKSDAYAQRLRRL